MRERAASADLAGASGAASWLPEPPLPTEPGTRLALGVRFGSPAVVVSSEEGSEATRAARYPSSAGELQVCPAATSAGAATAALELSAALPLFWTPPCTSITDALIWALPLAEIALDELESTNRPPVSLMLAFPASVSAPPAVGSRTMIDWLIEMGPELALLATNWCLQSTKP